MYSCFWFILKYIRIIIFNYLILLILLKLNRIKIILWFIIKLRFLINFRTSWWLIDNAHSLFRNNYLLIIYFWIHNLIKMIQFFFSKHWNFFIRFLFNFNTISIFIPRITIFIFNFKTIFNYASAAGWRKRTHIKWILNLLLSFWSRLNLLIVKKIKIINSSLSECLFFILILLIDSFL